MQKKKKLNNKGLMLVLSSPSGAGKTTLCKNLLKIDNSLVMSVSATTRPKRSSEIHGKDYYFFSEKKFLSEKKVEISLKQLKFLDIFMVHQRSM